MITLPKLFSNHMVLQREKPVAVWGKAMPYSKVTVCIQGQTKSCEAALDGNWRVVMDPLATSSCETLYVQDADSRKVVCDVAVGEVWLAGGQSNMEFPMRYVPEIYRERCNPDNPNLRFFDYPEVTYEGEEELENFEQFGFWRTARGEDLDYFSAVAYYFAKEIQADLDIPVGIVGCNLGGSPACAWIDEEHLRGIPAEIWLTEFQEATKNLDLDTYYYNHFHNPLRDRSRPFVQMANEYGLQGHGGKMEQMFQELVTSTPFDMLYLRGPYWQWRPCGLHYTMLRKVVPYGIRGFLFYQGESDAPHPDVYDAAFSALIRNWRDLWGEELPMLFVQLAPFGGEELNCRVYPTLRACQQKVADTVFGVHMAVITDVGDEQEVHPKRKEPVGHRLALLARRYVYGENVEADAPRLKEIQVREGSIALRFAHVAEGLTLEGELTALEVEQDGVVVKKERAEVTAPDTVTVSGAFRENTKTVVRLACTPYYEVNLYNSAHLPACPAELRV